MVVKIEALKKNVKVIPQCKRCQGFNHTQAYCTKDLWCVKCAGKHHMSQYSKQTYNPYMCQYKGDHSANYRGCEVAIELQRRRNNAMTTKNQKKRDYTQYNDNVGNKKEETILMSSRNIHTQGTYAQATERNITENVNTSIIDKFDLIFRRLEEQNATNKLINDKF